MIEHDPVDRPHGGKLSGMHYYRVEVPAPMADDLRPYSAECGDIIEALDMTFNEGEAFKALWRLAAGRQGRGKCGTSAQYDADKVAHYGARVAAHSPLVAEGRVPAPDYVGDMVDAYGKARREEIDQDIWDAAVQMRRDWKPITAEEVKRARDVWRSQTTPRYATRVYDLDGNMRLTYPPFAFNWDAVEPGNDWVAMDPRSGHVYSYSWKPVYQPSKREWWLPADAPDEADAFFETCLQDALPDGVFLIERVRLDG